MEEDHVLGVEGQVFADPRLAGDANASVEVQGDVALRRPRYPELVKTRRPNRLFAPDPRRAGEDLIQTVHIQSTANQNKQ